MVACATNGGTGLRNFSASMVEWACARERPNLDIGGMRLPLTGDGMCNFPSPRTLSSSKADTLRDARDGTPSHPKKIIKKLHVHWGHAAAQQIKRVSVDSDGDKLHLLHHVDEVSDHVDEVLRSL